MLAPESRELLLDALRPPDGRSLDHAVATTYNLDLEAALTVPLAFAGIDIVEQPDPVAVMQALRGMRNRMDVFCQAGAIHANKWSSDLVALLEDVVHPVQRPPGGGIFHPKTWVLRFRDRSGALSYRLLVLSRNLTTGRSWDTILWLDGQPRRRLSSNGKPLAHFFGALPKMSVNPLSPARRGLLARLADELRRVHWELPGGAREVRFHPVGLPRMRRFATEKHFHGYRKLAISPFVGPGALRRFFQPESDDMAVLVSRAEELAKLPATALEHLKVYVLDSAASLEQDDFENEAEQSVLTQLHAKVYVVERARLARLFVGSANATDSGLGSRNIEFLCELVGPVAQFGVEAMVGEKAGFREVLTPYVACDEPEIDAVGKAERELKDLLVDIATRVRFRTTASKQADGWAARIRSHDALPPLPEGDDLTLAPHNRESETYPIDPAAPVDLELPPRDLEDLTAFLQLTASRMVDGKPVQRSAVVSSRLTGAPDDRFQRILARQIDTPEKFMRLLSLLIGFDAGGAPDDAANGDGQGTWSTGPGGGVLELLARALSENTGSIDRLGEIVEHLRRSERGREVLPKRWDDVWKPAVEARQTMLAGRR